MKSRSQLFHANFLLIASLLMAVRLSGQKSTIDSNAFSYTQFPFEFNTKTIRLQAPFDYLYQNADKVDSDTYEKYKGLYVTGPTAENYSEYYLLGCSMWHLNKLDEARHVFDRIITSRDKYYSATYYHNSDVLGDTAQALYGYGSYSSSYKNSAALYLAKIGILQKRYKEALTYVQEAQNKYKTTYTCGTGAREQRWEYEYLTGMCYEGLKRYNDAMDLLMPHCLDRNDEIVARVIRKKYSQGEIKKQLDRAESSIVYIPDTSLSYEYRSFYDPKGKISREDTITYYSGKATIKLFGLTVNMGIPTPVHNSAVKRADLVVAFRESSFYHNLTVKDPRP